MNPHFVEFVWLAVKYTATVFTAFFGFYAIVTDFRVEQNGKKVLSQKAYWGMALLVISTALAIGSDAHKDKEDRAQANTIIGKLQSTAEKLEETKKAQDELGGKLKAAADTLGETKKRVDDNLSTTSSVLQETLRASDPIDHNFEVYTRIGVPLDQPPVQAYVKRVLALRKSNFNQFELKAGEPGFPDEKADGAVLANLAKFTQVTVKFYKSGRAHDRPELILSADCDTFGEGANRSNVEKEVTYDEHDFFSKAPLFEISCTSQSVHELELGASVLRSYREFPGLRVLVSVQIMALNGNPGIDFQLRQLGLVTPTSRRLPIPALKATPCPGGPRVYQGQVWTPEDVCFESLIPGDFRF